VRTIISWLSVICPDPRSDSHRSHLPRSRLEPSILALSLLRLLSQNRIADFHTLVETLAEDEGRKKDVLESKEVGWVMQVRGGIVTLGISVAAVRSALTSSNHPLLEPSSSDA
jgi:hypothetical protein